MVLMLTWAAGSVDAISYLALDHVFTANMTGNTVLLGLAIGQGHGWRPFGPFVPWPGLALGRPWGPGSASEPRKGEAGPPPAPELIFFGGASLGVFPVPCHFL